MQATTILQTQGLTISLQIEIAAADIQHLKTEKAYEQVKITRRKCEEQLTLILHSDGNKDLVLEVTTFQDQKSTQSSTIEVLGQSLNNILFTNLTDKKVKIVITRIRTHKLAQIFIGKKKRIATILLTEVE